MSEKEPFDPSRHLTLVSGKEYLEVKYRIQWLRSEHPDATIRTEMVSHKDNEAVFFAHIAIPDGGAATGHGSEDARGFGDYLEKAETKAIGRALAALGYGTQFCADFDFGAAQGRVVDSPVAPRVNNATERQFQRTQSPPRQQQAASNGRGRTVTEKQAKMFWAKCQDNNVDHNEILMHFGVATLEDLPGDKRTVEAIISFIEQGTELPDGGDSPAPLPKVQHADSKVIQNWKTQIGKATTPERLDAIWESITKAGLETEQELIRASEEQYDRIFASMDSQP